tara:strand:+ start:351 stop:503 length:153 start_codon:yes stop_codon:yes gene_type:complete
MIWQINPEEEHPKPFKAEILHRGCIRYNPQKLLRKLIKEVERKNDRKTDS